MKQKKSFVKYQTCIQKNNEMDIKIYIHISIEGVVMCDHTDHHQAQCPSLSEACRTPRVGIQWTFLQTFPPHFPETMQECARAPGFLYFCWGLQRNYILTMHVSVDRRQARGRWLCGLAQRRTAQRTGKQSDGQLGVTRVRSSQTGSQMESSRMRTQTGILAQRVRPKQRVSRPTITSASLDPKPRDWPVVPEGKELVKRPWSGL